MSGKLQFFLPLAVWLAGVSSQSFCGDNPPTYRNNDLTCPARAVCADVISGERNWGNGTRCASTMTMHNCMCPGGTQCPVGNTDHRLYASATHQQYTCEPVCNLPYCNNIPDTTVRGNTERPSAVRSISNSADFNYNPFYRVDCRCPRHHQPAVGRSVKTWTHKYIWDKNEYHTIYICNYDNQNYRLERHMADPCDSQ